MSTVRLAGVTKSFVETVILQGIDLTVEDREFMVIVGPSGCGKTTLLRLIAGLETIAAGDLWIDGVRVNDVAPARRGLALVFQSYALYPHMTVEENMAFSLKLAGVPKAERRKKVEEAARILHLEAFLDRKPKDLSGGQRQRVAIGRAIVKEPKAFLFDEPLSNLDAALRVRTRLELAQLRNRVQSTMVFVTHDQIEAMTLADRIVVMNNRRIEQIGSPMDIYTRPASRFVAAFVGSPTMNFLSVKLSERDGFLQATVADGSTVETAIRPGGIAVGGDYTLGIRAEAVKLAGSAPAAVTGKVDVLERLGDRTLLYVRLADESIIVAEDIGNSRVAVGDTVSLTIDGTRVHLFDADGRAWHCEESLHG